MGRFWKIIHSFVYYFSIDKPTRNHFDYVLITWLGMGIGGAAIATGLGYSVTAVVGLFVFSWKKSMHGIWPTIPAAELVVLLLSAYMFLEYRKRCGY